MSTAPVTRGPTMTAPVGCEQRAHFRVLTMATPVVLFVSRREGCCTVPLHGLTYLPFLHTSSLIWSSFFLSFSLFFLFFFLSSSFFLFCFKDGELIDPDGIVDCRIGWRAGLSLCLFPT